MRRTLVFLALVLSMGATCAITACGCGSGTGGGAANPEPEGGADSTSAVGMPADGGGGGSTGTDTGASSPSGPGGEDAGCATRGASACRTCCSSAYPTAAATLVKAELQCGCAASLCGPSDAAVVDSDAGEGGVPGPGSCDVSTCDMKAKPAAACLRCLEAATGTKTTPGACFEAVSSACSASSDCMAYGACVASCPK